MFLGYNEVIKIPPLATSITVLLSNSLTSNIGV